MVLADASEIGLELLGLDAPPQPPSSAPAADAHEGEPPSDSLEGYFRRFVLEHQHELTETEMARRLGISRKALWERRQRLRSPGRAPEPPSTAARACQFGVDSLDVNVHNRLRCARAGR